MTAKISKMTQHINIFKVDSVIISMTDSILSIIPISKFQRHGININHITEKTTGSKLRDNKIISDLINGRIDFSFIQNM